MSNYGSGWIRQASQKAGFYPFMFRQLIKLNQKFGFDAVPHMDAFGDDNADFIFHCKIAQQRSLLSQDKLFLALSEFVWVIE